MKYAFLTAPALLALAACSDSGETDDPDSMMDASEAAATTDGETPAAGAAATSMSEIPVALRGRWGMTEADCNPDEPANKGLMEVSPTMLKFYESLGTLGETSEAGPTRIRATYDFEGEGMQWQREILLEAEAGSQALMLSEFGEDAAAEPRRYEKCS
jgi:hypothetical protein